MSLLAESLLAVPRVLFLSLSLFLLRTHAGGVNDAPRIHTWRVSREGRKARGKRRGSRRVHTHAENVCRELSPAIDPRSLARSRRHSYVASRGR